MSVRLILFYVHLEEFVPKERKKIRYYALRINYDVRLTK